MAYESRMPQHKNLAQGKGVQPSVGRDSSERNVSAGSPSAGGFKDFKDSSQPTLGARRMKHKDQFGA